MGGGTRHIRGRAVDSASRLSPGRLRAVQRLALDAALAEIVETYRARGIGYLLLKGPAFAQWLYDDPATRTYIDLDVLVAPADFPAARRALGELGFCVQPSGAHAHDGSEHHEGWLRKNGLPARVELHHTLALLPASAETVWEELARGAGQITVGRQTITVPSLAASALIVALHAAQHGVGDAQPMEDLRRALRKVDPATWRAAASLARKLDVEATLAAGLCLEPAGRALARRLGLPAEGSRLVRLHASSAPATAFGIEQLVRTRGLANQLRLLRHELVPSPAFMRAWQPMARRGRVGLLLAYLWRPAWLLAKLPLGLRAWADAVASGSASGRGDVSPGGRSRSRRRPGPPGPPIPPP